MFLLFLLLVVWMACFPFIGVYGATIAAMVAFVIVYMIEEGDASDKGF